MSWNRLKYGVHESARTKALVSAVAISLSLACGAEPDAPEPVEAPQVAPTITQSEATLSTELGLHVFSLVFFGPEPLARVGSPRSLSFTTDATTVAAIRLLPTSAATATIRLNAAPGNGAEAIERWPRTSGDADEWVSMSLRRGACASPSAFPAASDEVCATADGKCDAVNGALRFPADGDCLSVGGASTSGVLLRTTFARSRLPLDIRLRGESIVLVSQEPRQSASSVIRLRRASADAAFTASRFEFPEGSESMALHDSSEDEAMEPSKLVESLLLENELTSAERGVLAKMLEEHLSAENGVRDVVFYSVRADEAAHHRPLEATPRALEATRVMLFGVVLAGAPRAPRPRASSPTIRVRLDGQSSVSGGSLEAHRRTVIKGTQALEPCALLGFGGTQAYAERFVVRYQAGASGLLRSTSMENPAGGNALVAGCIEAAFLSFAFPESRSPMSIGRVPISVLVLPPR